MANSQYFQGRNLVVYWDGIPVGCSKTCSFELTTDVSDSTTKCDVKSGVLWARNSPQKNSWSITDSGVVPIQNSAAMATEHSLMFFVQAQASQIKGYAQFEDPSNPGIFIGGDVWITSTKSTGALTEDTTYDITLTGDGPIDFLPLS